MTERCTRLAPSPTGALHLGNVRTFLITWALARQNGWAILMRIEDLDHPRVKPETIDSTREELQWLGLDWEHEMPLQSTDLEPCHAALEQLGATGRIYRCDLSRSEIERSAPHDDEQQATFPTKLRPGDAGKRIECPGLTCNWRLMVDDCTEVVHDQFAGTHQFTLSKSCGDFPVWTAARKPGADGGPTYQLAVVVDDARQAVTDVVRGDDLLESAARQQMLYRLLDRPCPNWWHVPLVRGSDGKRLAKRHGDTRLSSFRTRGCTAEQIIGLMAYWCGMTAIRTTMPATDFLSAFDLTKLPSEDVTLGPEDLQWLC